MIWMLFGLLMLGGAIGLYITVKVLSGYVRGMKKQ
jgi:hypothetical protein